MTIPSFNRKFGRTEFPSPVTGDTTLASLDPARDIVLDVLKAGINADLGLRWDGVTNGTPLAGSLPVQRAHPHEPDIQYLREVKTDFPALFVYRDGDAEIDDIGIWRSRLTQRWGVDYVLGPLDAGNMRKLGDVLTAVAKLVAQIVQMGGHPAYGVGGNNVHPLQVFGAVASNTVPVCGFASIEAKAPRKGVAKFSEGGPAYYALSMTLVTTEVDNFIDPTRGTAPNVVDWGYGLDNQTDEPLEDLVEASSDV